MTTELTRRTGVGRCSGLPKVPTGSLFCWRGLLLLAALAILLPRNNGAGAERAEPAEEPEIRFTLSEEEWPQCVAFSPDGRKILAGTNAGRLWVWERKKGAVPEKIRLTSGRLLSGPVLCLGFSPEGGRALAGCADRMVRVVDLTTAKVTQVLQGHEQAVFSVAFCRDGQHALSGSAGSVRTASILLWDLKTGQPVRRYNAKDVVYGLALAPDERRFLTTEFKSIQEWDLQSGERLRTLEGHESRIYSVFYSSDGQTIISGGYGQLRTWDAKTGKCVRTVGEDTYSADHFALSPDGRRILLGTNKEMQLLGLKTGQELKRWKGLVGKVWVAFSPDGRYALSGEEHGPVSLWRLPEGDKATPPGK